MTKMLRSTYLIRRMVKFEKSCIFFSVVSMTMSIKPKKEKNTSFSPFDSHRAWRRTKREQCKCKSRTLWSLCQDLQALIYLKLSAKVGAHSSLLILVQVAPSCAVQISIATYALFRPEHRISSIFPNCQCCESAFINLVESQVAQYTLALEIAMDSDSNFDVPRHEGPRED